MNSNCVSADNIEDCRDIPNISATDISPFRIQNDGDMRIYLVNVLHRSDQGSQASISLRLIKGRVGLIDAHQIMRRVNDLAVKSKNRLLYRLALFHACWKLVIIGI